MSFSNLNEFPARNLPLNINSTQLTILIVGYLIEFVVLQLLLHRKRISSFLLGLQSQFLNSHDPKNHDNPIKNTVLEPSADQEKKVDDLSVCRGELEIILRSLGICLHGDDETKLPAKLGADEIFNIFEEKNPSLDEVKEAFDVFDSNRDGYIDEMELQKVLCALGLKKGLTMENCRRMIRVFDEDEDGRIDFNEFVKFMENNLN